jgi:hypothetical protein
MEVQMNSWTKLKANLPCDGCLAGKMCKTNKAQSSAFTPAYNLALSWTPQTTEKVIIPNKDISTDWGIINKQLLPGKNNVFALFLDLNTGWIAVYPQPNRGLAGKTLEQYCQDHGSPSTITHDNAAEYINGNFKTLCTQKEITQRFSAPHTPNQNPAEHYMDILMGKTRSLLFISGNPKDYLEQALQHAACLQNRTALPGRTTPYQYTHGSNQTSVTSASLVVKHLPMWRKKRDINWALKVNDVSTWAFHPDTLMTHTPFFVSPQITLSTAAT